MPTVELVYDRDCPNLAEARAQLVRAFGRAKVKAHWKEWCAADPESPEHVRGYGSPTILVNGRDIAGTEDNGGPCCRLYAQADGSMQGVPSIEAIAKALDASDTRNAHIVHARAAAGGGGWTSHLAMLPGVGAALLPKVACPACWPAYAGFLSALGLGFLVNTAYLLPLTAVFLAVAVGALAFCARRRRGYGPFSLGLVASALVLIGKFHFDSAPTMYGGLALVIAASLWNSWPRKPSVTTCAECAASDEPTTQPVR